MSDENEAGAPEFDKNDLYREDTFTDRKVGTIRQMTPVTENGETDSARDVLFMGATQVMTAAGPMPLNFDIPGSNLGEAADNFGDCAQKAVEEMAAKLEEMRREQSSSIVVPGQGGQQGGSGLIGV
ncbi:MAG: hypothetical protein ACR2QG_05330 [Gammaproteobacteria bacterium]